MYSVTSRRSFEAVFDTLNEIERVRETIDVPIILVGNKCDLESERVITKGGKVSAFSKLGLS